MPVRTFGWERTTPAELSVELSMLYEKYQVRKENVIDIQFKVSTLFNERLYAVFITIKVEELK